VVVQTEPAEYNQETLDGQALLDRRRLEAGIHYDPPKPQPTAAEVVAVIQQPDPEPASTPEPQEIKPPETVKAYPYLLTAFYKADLAPVGRVYHVIRAIDHVNNVGWLDLAQLRSMLTDKRSPWRICGKRNLRMIMSRGRGIAWDITANGRVRYKSPDKILIALGAGRLRGKPVKFPVKSGLLSGIQAFKARILESWHAGRGKETPISQHATSKETGIPESSQRRYNNQKSEKTKKKLNGVTRRRNDAIGGRKTIESYHAAGSYHGNCLTFVDYIGKMGAPGQEYVSWRLPNSYETQIEQTATGRQKKINKSIALVIIPERGKNDRVDKLYYQNSGEAGSAYNCNPEHDCYFPMVTTMTRTTANKAKLQEVRLWSVLPGQS